ncbi:MAG: polymer-forming cytoskeletal protein [Candidatus Omnitrophota bacterium]
MRKKRQNEVPQEQSKILDVSASMQGTLRFDDPVNLRINGKFEGTLDTKGSLMVGRDANINANINGEIVSVAGNVWGNIKATRILVLEESAHLQGDVETPRISIMEGAFLNGNIKMSTSAGTDEEKMTIAQLAKYLEVDEAKINDWLNSGNLPGAKEGSKWIFERNKIDQWIAAGKVKD